MKPSEPALAIATALAMASAFDPFANHSDRRTYAPRRPRHGAKKLREQKRAQRKAKKQSRRKS